MGCPGVSLVYPSQYSTPRAWGRPREALGAAGVCAPLPLGHGGFPCSLLLSPTSERVAGACGQGTKASLLEIPGSLQRCAVVGQGEGAEQSNPKCPPPPARAAGAASERGF